MSSYLSLFKIKFINNLQYRSAALAGILTQIFFGLVFIMVYIAFYTSNDNQGPIALSQLVTYLWLNQIFFTLVFIFQSEEQLLTMIRNGNIAYELCRPMNFYFKWFVTLYASRIAKVALRFLPVILLALILPSPYNLSLPYGIKEFIVFLLALLLSSLLATALSIIYHLLVFYLLDERGILTLLGVVGEIFSGLTIPIAFFQKKKKTIAYLLPFHYICDLPFRIYSGNISLSVALPNLIGGLIWLILFGLLGYMISKKMLKKAVIQGG